MELNYKAQEKRNEVMEVVKDVIMSNETQSIEKNSNFSIQEISSMITDRFVYITPFSIETSSRSIFMEPGGMGGGTSKKTGNILLDWRELFVICSDSVLTIVGAVSIPLLIPLAALVVWNKYYSLTSIQITERTAAVIWTMWKNRDIENCIRAEKILDLTNLELLSYSLPKMTQGELEIIIKDLEKIKCIEKTEENKLWLREQVIVAYD